MTNRAKVPRSRFGIKHGKSSVENRNWVQALIASELRKMTIPAVRGQWTEGVQRSEVGLKPSLALRVPFPVEAKATLELSRRRPQETQGRLLLDTP